MNKELWLIWKQPHSRRRYIIGILSCYVDEYGFEYKYPEFEEAKNNGFDFFPGFEEPSEKYKSKEMFANISTRLPNVNRPDYLELIKNYGLESNSTKWEILEKTKGRLLTDSYEFIPAFDQNKIDFDLAGTKYCKDVQSCNLNIDDDLKLELDPKNAQDKNAIKVICEKNGTKYHLGYVPRYYTSQMAELLRNGAPYCAKIQSLNFDSPLNDEDISARVELIFKAD